MLNAGKPIILYGMGNGADRVLDQTNKLGIPIYGVFSSDEFCRYQSFRGFTVKKMSDIEDEISDFIVLVCFGTNRPEVIANIKNISAKHETYSVDVPVYGDTVFDENFARANFHKFIQVYEQLGDERSRFAYENVLKFKYSGNLDYLFAAQDSPEERYNLLNLTNQEKYLDLGAYNGDSVMDFIVHTRGFDSITAVEPNPKTVEKLKRNTTEYSINILNVGISDHIGKEFFDIKAGRGTSIGRQIEIPVTTVDEIGTDFTYIKADIEGAEGEMLRGMSESLKNCPKLVISAYHRTEDIFTLPLEILKIQPNYRIFYRHYPYLPAWDCEFIAIR